MDDLPVPLVSEEVLLLKTFPPHKLRLSDIVYKHFGDQPPSSKPNSSFESSASSFTPNSSSQSSKPTVLLRTQVSSFTPCERSIRTSSRTFPNPTR
ncbi:hypothetical protein PV326_000446, partial [Microctonus aethiopoides]